MLPQSIQDTIDALSDLPGIGQRSAERLVFALLRNESDLDQKLAQSLTNLKFNLNECRVSCNYCDGELCPIVTDTRRSQSTICVVETPLDLMAIERTNEFRGQYHVLHGVISPLNKVGPEDLRITQLIHRIQTDDTQVEEIILAMSGNVEGDATAFYITEQIRQTSFNGKVSRLARGIPTGGDLDYVDAGTLSRALVDRREF